MEVSEAELQILDPIKENADSIHFGKFKEKFTIIKNGNQIDISHIKRIRKNQDILEILLGT
jgi:hypothetical protein